MKNDRTFLKCEHCGNIIGLIEDSGVEMVCCGQKMTKLVPNTTEAAQEKHIPAVVRNGSKIEVTIGSVPHPMTEEHHISWVAVAQDGNTFRTALSPTGSPYAGFCCIEGSATVYAYCNLHGLWAVEI